MLKITLILCFLLLSFQLAAQTIILPFGSFWKYLDNGSNQATAWRSVTYSDELWKSGKGKFGYGITDAATLISFGPDAKKKYITTYFRKSITVDTKSFASYAVKIKRDDGAVVYVNGVEVYRNNLPTGSITSTTLAVESKDNGKTSQSFTIPATVFVNGTNLIAVEIHQAKASTPDMAFDLEVTGNLAPTPSPPADVTAPLVLSVNRQVPDTEMTTATSVTYRAVFSEAVTGVDATDFLATTISGTVKGAVATAVKVGTDATTYDVTVSTISGEGSLRLDLKSSGTGILDLAGNSISGGYSGGQSFIIQIADQTLPKVVSIDRYAPATMVTDTTVVVFRVTFSEQVTGVDVSDFSLTTLSGNVSGQLLNGAVASQGTKSTVYDVTVSSVSGSGIMRLDLKETDTGIADLAGNMIAAGYTSGQTYTIEHVPADQTPPVVVSINRHAPDSETTTATSVTYRTTFSEIVTGVDATDFEATGVSGTVTGTVATTNAAGSGTIYDVTVSAITGDGNLRLDLKNNNTGIADMVGNSIIGGFHDGQSFKIEKLPPSEDISPELPVSDKLISYQAAWKYLDNGTDQGVNWRSVNFNPDSWKTGNGKFGYGISDATTVLNFGPDAKKKYITTYFLKDVLVSDTSAYSYYAASIKRDDGVVVYVNGAEVYRNNMPTGTISYSSLAALEASDNATVPILFHIPGSAFAKGKNIIAVELHQKSVNSNDLAFDLELQGKTGAMPVEQAKILYYEGFENGTGFEGMHLQSSTTYGFKVVDNPTFSGAKVGRFELRKGDVEASGGARTEVLFTEALAQEITWHSFAAYFPSIDYADDTLSYEVNNQWHQGSSWGTPLLQMRIKNGRVYVNRRSTTTASIQYDLGPQPKDQWVNFVIHLKQHTKDGFMKIWINDQLRLNITGETMFPDTDPVPYGRWKMGIYKSDWNNGGTYKPSSTTVRVWYVDEVKIGNATSTYASMLPVGNNKSVLITQTDTSGFLLKDNSLISKKANSLLAVYPTLAKRGVALTVTFQAREEGEAIVSDAAGKIHYSFKLSGTATLETNNLPAGLYFLRLVGRQQSYLQKVIIVD